MSELDQMLGLVGRFYECALAPEEWEPALHLLGDIFDGAAVYMDAAGSGGFHSARVDTSLWTEEVLGECFTREHMALIELALRMPRVPPVSSRSLMTDGEFERTNTYQLMLLPDGLHHGLMAEIHRDAGGFSGIGIHKARGQRDFDRYDHERLALLLPHLSRALQTQSRLRGLEAERDAALAALDRLPMGVIMVGRDARVITMNAAAEEIIDMADGLSVTAGTLRAATPNDTAALAGLIARAAATGAGEGFDPGGALAVARPSLLRPLSVLVAPLRSEALQAGPLRPTAIVFVSDPEAEVETPQRTLARLYGLTPAEARLAAVLMQGHGLEWAADELGVTINTVRTHSRNLFDKTGVRRQAQLVRLVLRGPAGLRAP